MQECCNCRFATREGRVGLTCVRFPPVPLYVSDAFEPNSVRGYHPIVDAEGWCGEWRPNERDAKYYVGKGRVSFVE